MESNQLTIVPVLFILWIIMCISVYRLMRNLGALSRINKN